MLAFMPRSHPLPDFHSSTPLDSNTMSLAVLPSVPMSYNQQSLPTLQAPSPAKKPKLSLNTSNLSTTVPGKKTTSLRLETLSATSPTARNTFQNRDAEESKSRKLPLTPIATNVANQPSPISPPTKFALPTSPVAFESTTSPIGSVVSLSSEAPYELPSDTASILKNGPIRRSSERRESNPQSRPTTPSPKRVAFRAALTEDIENTTFTLKHSDIEISTSTLSPADVSKPDEDHDKPESADTNAISSPVPGVKRQGAQIVDESDSCPATPVAGRRKKDRNWEWTL